MKVDPALKILFPEKSDKALLEVAHPCNKCGKSCINDVCEDSCVLARLWKLYQEEEKRKEIERIQREKSIWWKLRQCFKKDAE